ncbi:MotA/TolQ/ExbB proton channel family protein [bacterium]|nr:MotA/TolQ/ExbB proton channel family protein [bacterium]
MDILNDVTGVGLGTLVVLLICSIVVISIVLERLFYLRNNVVNANWLHAYMAKFLVEGNIDEAKNKVSKIGGLLPRVYECGLSRFGLTQEAGEVAMSSAIAEQRLKLEKNMPIISTIAVISPFIGLFGTVGGIIKTFADVAEKGQAGVAVVSAGVSEALVATAFGLFVAITAVIAFNYFKARISRIVAEMTNAASHLSEMMELVRNHEPFPEDLTTFDVK